MNKLLKTIRGLFIVILFFSYPISFLDSFNSETLSNFTYIYYVLKKILLLFVTITLLTSSKERPTIVKLFLFGLLFFVLTFLIYKDRRPWLIDYIFDYFCCFSVFGAVVLSKQYLDSIINILIWGSRLFCILISYALFTQLDVDMAFFLRQNYMFFSNAMMIPCGILLYSAIVKRKYIDIPISIFCYILLLLGSRGSLLSMTLLAGTLYLLSSKGLKPTTIFFTCFLIVILTFIFNAFTDTGIIDIGDSRAFNFLKSGTNFSDEDRFVIWHDVIMGTQNPILGGGYLADRHILNQQFEYIEGNSYAHNIFVELYADLGILGLISAIYLYFQFLKQMIRRSSLQYIIIVFFFLSAFQLLFSRTVFIEPNFFILLGLLNISKHED